MKTTLTLAAVIGGTLAFSTPAQAGGFDFGVSFGFGHGHGKVSARFGHGHRRGHFRWDRHHHRHLPRVHSHCRHYRRAPIYDRVWVEPVYQTIVVGYDRYGCPVYRKTCVRNGYYRKVVTGYRCASCGSHF